MFRRAHYKLPGCSIRSRQGSSATKCSDHYLPTSREPELADRESVAIAWAPIASRVAGGESGPPRMAAMRPKPVESNADVVSKVPGHAVTGY